ncbi:MAG TPA: DEAD/DEAH box helicase [Actinomycetes bacterium]|nr:DEAD/DEAH box helicase [Actinomycetes bacterium]
MSTSAASHLSPAFPMRAPWGTASALRAWQEEAVSAYLARSGPAARDFLAVATPGAGKTTFALRVASELLERGVVHAVTVVAPTEHLKHQWADAASRVGIALDPQFRNAHGAVGRDYTGVAVTYAQVAAHPVLHRRRTEVRSTLVILDEVHHGGDALSWGDAVREAFDPATRRLALTGTPFRSDTSAIPFVTYAVGPDGVRRSAADYSYGYGRALADGVVRPVIFLSYSGQMRWRTRAGDEVSAVLGEPLTRDATAQAWRTALDPQGNWIPQVLAAADRRLTEVRHGVPDAGGLVVATDQASARAYAAQLRAITGQAPTVVLSDEAGASARIEEFADSDARWMVAVRMVSEGVDVPRLSVGVYATSTATPLYFAQAVGRFVRARRRGETASVFLPSVPLLLQHAAEMEAERDHALDRSPSDTDEHGLFAQEEALVAAANRTGTEPGADDAAFEALEAEAHFDRVLFDGGEFGPADGFAAVGSQDEADYLGLPGLLEPDQVATLLRARASEQAGRTSRRRPAGGRGAGTADPVDPADPVHPARAAATHRVVAALRKELNGLVGAWHHRTGLPHGAVHTELRQACGGPPAAQASAEQLQARIDLIRSWALRRR